MVSFFSPSSELSLSLLFKMIVNLEGLYYIIGYDSLETYLIHFADGNNLVSCSGSPLLLLGGHCLVA